MNRDITFVLLLGPNAYKNVISPFGRIFNIVTILDVEIQERINDKEILS